MFLRFPASSTLSDANVLQFGNTPFAYNRKATAAGKRTCFITEHTLLFVLHGHKLLHIGDQTFTAGEGHLVMMKRGVYAMSEFVPDGLDYAALLLFLNDEFVKKFQHAYLLTTPPATETPAHLVIPTNQLLNDFKAQFMGYFGKTITGLETILQLKLQEVLLLLLAGSHQKQVLDFLQSIAFCQPIEIDYIVRKHLFQPLTVEELAKLSGRSLASFKRDFQQQYQSSPKRWINDQRLEHARMLLRHTGKQVSEVAMECGFDNIPHFIRIFKQKYGTTPNETRAKKAII